MPLLRDDTLAQARAGVQAEIDTVIDRVLFWREGDRLTDDMQVAPTFGEAAVALERRAAAVVVSQIHRLARTVGRVA